MEPFNFKEYLELGSLSRTKAWKFGSVEARK